MKTVIMGIVFLSAIAADESAFDLMRKAEAAFAAGNESEALKLADSSIRIAPDDAALRNIRGSMRFQTADISGSIEDFDRSIALSLKQEPYHWQRGISYYYAGEFEKGVKQFELHQTVNSNDVENAVWHFLCMVRWKGLEAAREKLIPIRGDSRIPMAEIHQMFAGKLSPEKVLEAAQAADANSRNLRNQLCYAHLYIGIYFEAIGQAEESLKHIRLAAKDYAMPHYMGRVAQVHLKLRTEVKPDGAPKSPDQ